MFHPTREGTRGGRDQFSWDSVKDDKDRECYLGHSMMAPVGRWQKGKDLFWYTKDKNGTDDTAAQQRNQELQAIKDAEADALAEALGFAPQRKRKTDLSESELQSVLKREKAVQEEEDTAEDARMREADRVQGVGFKQSGRYSSMQADAIRASTGGLVQMEKGQVLPGRSLHRPAMVSATGSNQQPLGAARNLPSDVSSTARDTTTEVGDSKEDRSRKKSKKHKKERKESRRHRSRHHEHSRDDGDRVSGSDSDSERRTSHRSRGRYEQTSASRSAHREQSSTSRRREHRPHDEHRRDTARRSPDPYRRRHSRSRSPARNHHRY